MKTVILGGGLTGLSAAQYLSKKEKGIVILEKGDRLGGLAGGFKKPNWNWELERTYHHIFRNDEAILQLSKEIGHNPFVFSNPITASLFGERNNYRIFPVDSPKDFLFLPELSLFSKIRAGFTVVFLKLSPHFTWYEKVTSAAFLKKTMGGEVWGVLWEQLFKKKFGKYAEHILSSFIWARIHKRTQGLGYPTRGFQSFVDTLAQSNREAGVSIFTSTTINSVQKKDGVYEIKTVNNKGESKIFTADRIISTLPYPISCAVMKDVLGEEYIKEQSSRKYLFAINLIVKTKQPILPSVYWLNIGAKDVPIMCIVQHTNFVDSKEYGGEKLCYIAWYVDENSELLQMDEKQVLQFVLPHLRSISPHLQEIPEVVGFFKAPYAQPIFDTEFVSISRSFMTPAHNIYVANMDMTYPYDRGTNYAVQLGKDVSNFIINNT
ncbi:MAG: FAD-dependent oxidoreductase [Candidatus Roizmanbacteria bacterium]|nr:FAD-dependent oxidoreductase [Candidatus Roizmanbacteria bacterium]